MEINCSLGFCEGFLGGCSFFLLQFSRGPATIKVSTACKVTKSFEKLFYLFSNITELVDKPCTFEIFKNHLGNWKTGNLTYVLHVRHNIYN